MQTITATKARSNWFQILKEILKNKQPTRIHTKNGAVIMMPEEEFEGWMETSELLSTPGFREFMREGEEQIRNNELIDADELFKDIA